MQEEIGDKMKTKKSPPGNNRGNLYSKDKKANKQPVIDKEVSKWIDVVLVAENTKTDVYEIFDKNDYGLGIIKWYPQWRHYCLFPNVSTVFSDRCLIALGKFVKELNDNHGKNEE